MSTTRHNALAGSEASGGGSADLLLLESNPLSDEHWDSLGRAGELAAAAQTPRETSAVLAARAAVRRAATTEKLRLRRTRRRALGGASLAGLVAASVIVGITTFGSPDAGPGSAQAAVVLEHAADLVVANGEPSVDVGQYRKVTRVQESWNELGDGVSAVKTRETVTYWIPADSTQEWIVSRGDEELLERIGPSTFGPGEPTGPVVRAMSAREAGSRGEAWFAQLPVEPQALLSAILSDSQAEGSGTEYHFSDVYAEVLRDPVAPAEVRAALLRGLADLEGLTVEEATTPQGRAGVSVGYEGAFSERLLFDSATGEFVGQVNRNLGFDLPGGPDDHVNLTITVARALVSSAPSLG